MFLLVSPPAVDEEKQLVRDNALVEKYAKAVEEVAQEYHFRYADLCQAMLDAGDIKKTAQGMKNDGLHFGDAGYEILAKLIVKNLKSNVKKRPKGSLFFIQLNYLIAANNNPPTDTRARNGMSKYAQNTKINPAMSKKPKILIKPTPNLKKSQIKKIVNKSESIVSYLHNL